MAVERAENLPRNRGVVDSNLVLSSLQALGSALRLRFEVYVLGREPYPVAQVLRRLDDLNVPQLLTNKSDKDVALLLQSS